MIRLLGTVLALALVAFTAACGDDDAPQGSPAEDEAPADAEAEATFPDVVEVLVAPDGDGYRFDVTISSPYDTPERYADAWRVLAPDGTVLGVRELTHHHADEQPFTRSLPGVAIPAEVESVTVEARDLANGWGGATVTVDVP